MVIPEGEGQESKADFAALLARLRQYLQPEGVLEEILVERIAVCYWRLRRVLRAEVGEIRQGLDTARWQAVFARRDRLESARAALPLDDARQALPQTSSGLRYLIEILDVVIRDVQDEGHLCARAQQRLLRHFGDAEYGLAYWCLLVHHMATAGPELAAQDPVAFGNLPTPTQCQAIILEMLEEEKRKLGYLKNIIVENEGLTLEAQLTSLTLPSREAVEKILRYETAIERQLYRAMTQLERLQRQRQDEPVPPRSLGTAQAQRNLQNKANPFLSSIP